MSLGSPFPSQISSRVLERTLNPSRQGIHFPQDSSNRKSTKYLAESTMQVSSSITTMPPDPIMDPSLSNSSKSTWTSRCFSGINPPDGPPV